MKRPTKMTGRTRITGPTKNSKNEGSTAGCTSSAESPDWKLASANIPQDYVIVSSFISYGCVEWILVSVDDCITTNSIPERAGVL